GGTGKSGEGNVTDLLQYLLGS
ncbi:MAG: hypothetical protein JWO02_3275, partial [Solirubrobacterales bacterium]|nr:hypothetical protein [Solirubrobacterales bacterium]